jgi:hypothetical protein
MSDITERGTIVERLERHAAGTQRADGSTRWAEVGPGLARDALAEIERLRTIAERLYVALDAHYGVGRDGTDHFTRMALASYEEEAHRG